MPVFLHRMFTYSPCKPRSAWLRLLVGTLGLVLMLVLVAVGLVVGLGMLLFAAVRRLARASGSANAADEGVIDGQFTVVDKPAATPNLR
jgi:hypothetical protein